MTKQTWIDTALDVGASMDWITPTLSILSGYPTLAVPADEMILTQETLRDAGIKWHRDRLFDGRYVFDVSPANLDRAIALLGYERRDGCGFSLGWTLALIVFVAVVIAALVAI